MQSTEMNINKFAGSDKQLTVILKKEGFELDLAETEEALDRAQCVLQEEFLREFRDNTYKSLLHLGFSDKSIPMSDSLYFLYTVAADFIKTLSRNADIEFLREKSLVKPEEEDIERIKVFLNEKKFEGDWVEKTKIFEKEIEKYISGYKFHLGAEKIREFFWHTFCDQWIEEVKKKSDVENLALLIYLLKRILITMHPFMPFVTESVWQELVNLSLAGNLLMIQQREEN